jgi:pilus assembly protein CpaE
MSTLIKDFDELGTSVVSVALIFPGEERRSAVASAISGTQASLTQIYLSYPEPDDVQRLLQANYDVIIIELDSDPERALDLVESICGDGSVTVMVYEEKADSEMLVRCMRAGAREFLTEPIAPNTIAEAMVRASVRRLTSRPGKMTDGKLLVFIGAKGGSGVTTIAANYAVSLAKNSGRSTLLIDLNLSLGDAALDLGINTQYSTANALQNFAQLDFNFLSKLLTKHKSGLFVLAAPDTYFMVESLNEGVYKLLSIAKQNFDYIVVDAGSKGGSLLEILAKESSTVYLVIQVGVPELRNANRLILNAFKTSRDKLQVVLNRYTPRMLGIDEESINKALTMPVRWKIPSDYHAVRNAQNTATPLALNDSPISKAIGKMTREVYGSPEIAQKKKRFKLFR